MEQATVSGETALRTHVHHRAPPPLARPVERECAVSTREQIRAVRLVGRLGDAGRAELREDDERDRDHHPLDLQQVELQRQRGFWSYLVEDLDVFDAARTSARSRLSEHHPRQS